jgi:hypothetical protein
MELAVGRTNTSQPPVSYITVHLPVDSLILGYGY